ncbi:hypothetical protein T4D_13170 [Trichinella pseudospiralis]|uniref:Uncharacterized protein n=1 Tax=Trichinella pseudospiralis TaxID=6337 RepID=A0A0V1F4F7_TRIPS|nr:hypothetical protein T4D_13170 [Trichinella pseudospiralis]
MEGKKRSEFGKVCGKEGENLYKNCTEKLDGSMNPRHGDR